MQERNRHFLTKIKKATKIWVLRKFAGTIWIFSTKHTRNIWILYWLYQKKQYYQKQHLNKSVRGEKAGLPLPSNVEGISSNILLILTAKNTTPMNSPKNHVRYSKQITLTYPDAKKLSKEISCINKDAVMHILSVYKIEYERFNPDPLPLSEEGFEELRNRLVELHKKDCISLDPSEVFELIRNASEFLAFKQELRDFINQLISMEIRRDDEGLEFLVPTPMLRKWIPVLCSYYSH